MVVDPRVSGNISLLPKAGPETGRAWTREWPFVQAAKFYSFGFEELQTFVKHVPRKGAVVLGVGYAISILYGIEALCEKQIQRPTNEE